MLKSPILFSKKIYIDLNIYFLTKHVDCCSHCTHRFFNIDFISIEAGGSYNLHALIDLLAFFRRFNFCGFSYIEDWVSYSKLVTWNVASQIWNIHNEKFIVQIDMEIYSSINAAH